MSSLKNGTQACFFLYFLHLEVSVTQKCSLKDMCFILNGRETEAGEHIFGYVSHNDISPNRPICPYGSLSCPRPGNILQSVLLSSLGPSSSLS